MRGGKKISLAGVLVILGLGATGALAATSSSPPGDQNQPGGSTPSLYSGPGPRPGPSILYARPTVAPELTNTGIWHAKPILISGTTAYRNGEFLYQDWIYDDTGARQTPDPHDPRTSGNLFSKPNGTYTYPTGPGYDNNAADLVEFRVKPTSRATAFRITLNTLQNPRLMAFSIAIGGKPKHSLPFPDGANVSAPASLFLTVHPSGHKLVGSLTHAGSGKPVRGRAPRVHVDLLRHQITVLVPHSDWNPRRSTVRFAMGVGLWDSATHSYLLPTATASATQPGGAGTATKPAAFFNVAFRTNRQELLPTPTAGVNDITTARWWRDQAQGTALRAGNISRFYANVSFAKLWRRVTDNIGCPRTAPWTASCPATSRSPRASSSPTNVACRDPATPRPASLEYLGALQPYAIYVPAGRTPRGGWGLTLLLHSLSANYNQYAGTRNQRNSPSVARPRSSSPLRPADRISSTRAWARPTCSRCGTPWLTCTGSTRPTATSPGIPWAGSGPSIWAPSSPTCSPGRSPPSARRRIRAFWPRSATCPS